MVEEIEGINVNAVRLRLRDLQRVRFDEKDRDFLMLQPETERNELAE